MCHTIQGNVETMFVKVGVKYMGVKSFAFEVVEGKVTILSGVLRQRFKDDYPIDYGHMIECEPIVVTPTFEIPFIARADNKVKNVERCKPLMRIQHGMFVSPFWVKRGRLHIGIINKMDNCAAYDRYLLPVVFSYHDIVFYDGVNISVRRLVIPYESSLTDAVKGIGLVRDDVKMLMKSRQAVWKRWRI